PATPTISFGSAFPTQITYGQTLDLSTLIAPAGSVITSTSPVPLTFAALYSPTNACQVDVDGHTLRVDRSSTVAAGNPSLCVVAVSQLGNETYAPKTVSSPAITVNQSQQNIAFAALSPRTYGDPSFAVSATSSSPTAVVSSGNPIVFSASATACTSG